MEIERKWLVNGWPKGLRPEHIYTMEQGYLALRPTTVRIRRKQNGRDDRIHLVLQEQRRAGARGD